ncbi:MAG: Hsp20 family protein [Patescibacteria group bacterium]|jgi:HSP20 family protein
MDEDNFSLENKLKEIRREHALSQEELADALGISRQSVIALEQGRFLPSLPIAVSICRFFDLAFEELFNLQDELQNNSDEKSVNIKIVGSQSLASGKEKNMPGDIDMWRPIRETVSLRDAVDRLLEDSFITPKMAVSAVPKIDVRERKEDIVIRAELPGISEEEIDIEVSSDGVVTISGEKKEEKEEKEEGFTYKESFSGKFSRSFSLPTDVVAEKADAKMENGVLAITVPKAHPQKTQKLKISAKK